MSKRGENIHKRKDGRWEARYIKGRKENGKAIYGYVYARTYRDVKTKLRNTLIENDKKTSTKELTFNEVLEQWLSYKQNFVKQSTYNKYINTYVNYIKQPLGLYHIDQIDERLIQNYVLTLSKQKNYRTNELLSISTLRIVVYIIKSTTNFAYKQNYIKPIQLEIELPSYEKKPIQILPKKEQKILETYLIVKHDCFSLSILICLYTGIRIGELCALRWSDIDFNNRIILIHNTVQRIQNKENDISKTKLQITKPKTKNSIRRIPITSYLYDILNKYFVQNHEKSNYYIFRNKENGPIDPRKIQKHFKSIIKKLHLTSITFHSLRHTFATLCIEVGMDIKTLSEILGHSNVSTTMSIYVHSTESHKRKQIELLSKL